MGRSTAIIRPVKAEYGLIEDLIYTKKRAFAQWDNRKGGETS